MQAASNSHGRCQQYQMREPIAPGGPQVGGTPARNPNRPNMNQNTTTLTNTMAQSQETIQPNQLNVIDSNNHDTTLNQPTDTYYTPWGNNIQLDKRPQTVRLALQNFGRWPQWNNHYKNQAIRQFFNKKQSNIFLTTKNNVAWHQILASQRLPEWT